MSTDKCGLFPGSEAQRSQGTVYIQADMIFKDVTFKKLNELHMNVVYERQKMYRN